MACVKSSFIFGALLTGLFQFEVVKGDFELVILHTNDVHARVEQSNSRGGVCKPSDAEEGECVGGVARRKTAIDLERSRHDHVLLLDAGDQFQGTLWFSYYKGVEAFTFMNMLGYDAMALGNHEFDNGVAGLIPFVTNVTFPVLSCNINLSREAELARRVQPYTILHRGGRNIAVIGVITTTTKEIVDPRWVETMEFSDEVTSVREALGDLQKEDTPVHFTIVIGHVGFLTDQRIAMIEGVDLIVGGHSNTFLYTGNPPSHDVVLGPYPTIVNQPSGKQVPVVQDYAYGKYLGKLVLNFTDDMVLQSWNGNPIFLNSTITEDANVQATVSAMSSELKDFGDQIIATSLVHMDGSRQACRMMECNLGNALTDALIQRNLRGPTAKEWTTSAIALWNSGGIRTSIEQGDITIADILVMMPFSSEVVQVTVSGRTLLEVLENSVSQYDTQGLNPPGRFLQMSGLRVVYDLSRAEGDRVVSAEAVCTDCNIPKYRAVNVSNHYVIITSAYMARGGDGFTMLRYDMIHYEPLGFLGSDQFQEYLQKETIVYPGLDGRIMFSEGNTESTAGPHSICPDCPVNGIPGANPQFCFYLFMAIIVYRVITSMTNVM